MHKRSKRVLIIGGCGYIGSSLFLYLKKRKYFVDTIDIEWYGNYVNPANLKIDYETLDKKFLKKYDVIILLAAHSSVSMCLDNNLESFDNNVTKFVHLLRKIDKQVFIYASSSSIYGNTTYNLTAEDYNNYLPNNSYDLAKKTIDHYAYLSSTRFYGLRLGTVCGGSPNLRIDLMINKMYHSAKKYNKITIFNEQTYRPILGMRDLCRAIEVILEKKAPIGFYNLASFNSSVGEISQELKRSLGRVEIEKKYRKVMYNFSISTKKFEKEFGFKFKDTVGSIARSLSISYDTAHKAERSLIPSNV